MQIWRVTLNAAGTSVLIMSEDHGFNQKDVLRTAIDYVSANFSVQKLVVSDAIQSGVQVRPINTTPESFLREALYEEHVENCKEPNCYHCGAFDKTFYVLAATSLLEQNNALYLTGEALAWHLEQSGPSFLEYEKNEYEKFQSIKDAATELGFSSEREMMRYLAAVKLTEPKDKVSFREWQENHGTKTDLINRFPYLGK